MRGSGHSREREGQFHSLQARLAASADDDVVMHGDDERGGDIPVDAVNALSGCRAGRWFEPMLGYGVRSRRAAMRISVGVAP